MAEGGDGARMSHDSEVPLLTGPSKSRRLSWIKMMRFASVGRLRSALWRGCSRHRLRRGSTSGHDAPHRPQCLGSIARNTSGANSQDGQRCSQPAWVEPCISKMEIVQNMTAGRRHRATPSHSKGTKPPPKTPQQVLWGTTSRLEEHRQTSLEFLVRFKVCNQQYDDDQAWK